MSKENSQLNTVLMLAFLCGFLAFAGIAFWQTDKNNKLERTNHELASAYWHEMVADHSRNVCHVPDSTPEYLLTKPQWECVVRGEQEAKKRLKALLRT